MSTTTTGTPGKAPRKPTRTPAPDTCSLVLRIRGESYTVKPTSDPDGRAFRLRNVATGKVYDVAEGQHGPTCDCPDATYRHDGSDGTFCKHVRALSALNLITLDFESDPRTWPSYTDRACYAPGC